MRFLFHTLSLTSSGGSRVVCNLASYLCEKGHNVTILLDRNRVAFPVHPKVKILLLKEHKILDITPQSQGDTSAFKKHTDKKVKKTKKIKLRHKYKTIESLNEWKKYLLKLITYPSKKLLVSKLIKDFNPDIIISHNMYYFLEHYFFYKNNNFSVVLHNSPKQVFIDRTVKSIFPIKRFFNDTSCVGVSTGVQQEMSELFPKSNPCTIYNPLDIEEIKKQSLESIPEFYTNNRYIVTVSSLAPGKRIDRTIKSFSKIDDKDIKLVIMGNGEEKPSLEKLICDLNISDRVVFTGFIENPLPYMKNAEFLSFTSDYEGLGLVLVESLACKTPVVSTNCPSGPSEILVGDLSKYLVDIKNREEKKICSDLTNIMNELISSPPKIIDEHVEKFDKNSIVSQWEELASTNNKYA